MAPNVKTVLEIDLNKYLKPPKSWIVPLVRPKNPVKHNAKVLDFVAEMKRQNTTLDFEDKTDDRVAAYFHTGGTTGTPKVAQHKQSGMVYNGWLGREPSVQRRRRDHLPAAAVPRLCGPRDLDGLPDVGRAFRASDPCGLSRRWRL